MVWSEVMKPRLILTPDRPVSAAEAELLSDALRLWNSGETRALVLPSGFTPIWEVTTQPDRSAPYWPSVVTHKVKR